MSQSKISSVKVGLFVALSILGILTLSLMTRDLGMSWSGYYRVYVIMDNAEGISHKTPVQVAGIQVGYVDGIELDEDHRAKIAIQMRKNVKVRDDSIAAIRTRGVLGDTYIEILKGTGSGAFIEKDQSLTHVMPVADFNSLTANFNEIAGDLKLITAAIKDYTVDKDSRMANILRNMDEMTKNLNQITANNAGNLRAVLENMRVLTEQIRQVSHRSAYNVDESLDRIASITRKIDQGQGSLGRIINDDATINKINEAADNLNQSLGAFNRMKSTVGYHLEYLGNTKDFKHYVSLSLAPKPDKEFLFEVVSDSDPSPTSKDITTTINNGTSIQTINTKQDVIDRNKVLFSAQIAKSYKDFRIRGGIIESSGGVGVDYRKGPVDLQFSAFDFRNDSNFRPHLKFLANYYLTGSFYLLAGVDDFISKQHGPDWFVGAGVKLNDDDIKSLLGLAGIAQ